MRRAPAVLTAQRVVMTGPEQRGDEVVHAEVVLDESEIHPGPEDLGIDLPDDDAEAIDLLLRKLKEAREEAGAYLRELRSLCARMRRGAKEPISVFGERISVSISVGGALARDARESAEQLLHAADHAMYRAKQSQCNRLRWRVGKEGCATAPGQASKRRLRIEGKAPESSSNTRETMP